MSLTDLLVSGPLTLQKLGHIILAVRGVAFLDFGLQEDFIVGFLNSPDFYYYKYQSGSFRLIWQKQIPENLKFNCWKYTLPSGDIFLQLFLNKASLYDQQLRPIRTLHVPGIMIGVLHGGRYAVVKNNASPGVLIKLSVVSASDLGSTHHRLDVPPEGEYDRDDILKACGREESGVAVTVWNKPFVDIYDPAGELYTIYTYMIQFDIQ